MRFYSEIGTHLFILCFSLYQTVLKKHTKIRKRTFISSEIPRLYTSSSTFTLPPLLR